MSLLGDIAIQLANPLVPAATKTVLTNAQNQIVAYNQALDKLNGKFKAAIGYAEPADGYGNNAPLVSTAVDALVSSLASSRESVQALQNNFQTAQLLAQAAQTKADKAAADLTVAQQALADAKADAASAQQWYTTQLNLANSTIQAKEATIQAKTETLNGLTDAMREANNTIAQQRTAIQADAQTISGLQADRQVLQLTLQDMTANYAMMDQNLTQAQGSVDSLTMQLGNAQADNQYLHGQLTEMATTHNGVMLQLSNTQEQLSSAKVDVSTITDALKASQQKSAEQDVTIKSQLAMLTAGSTERNTLNQEVSRLTSLVTERDVAALDLQGTISQLNAEVTRLKAQFEEIDLSTAREVLLKMISLAENEPGRRFTTAEAKEMVQALDGNPDVVDQLNMNKRGGAPSVILYIVALAFEKLATGTVES